MAVIAINEDLDVINKYVTLLDETMGVDSIYIRTKETLTDLISKGDMSSADSAKVISEVLGSLNTSLVNATMSTALEWAKSEKGIELQLEELKYQVDILEQKKLMDIATTNKINAEIGCCTTQSTKLYGPGGKTDKEIELMSQQILTAQEETKMIASKVKESQASVYKLVADTMANFGTASYSISEGGVGGSVGIGAGALGTSQITIATKQAAGYAYNAWANASQALSSVVAMQMTEGATTSNIGDLLALTSKLSSAAV